jgi:hypothetical protein
MPKLGRATPSFDRKQLRRLVRGQYYTAKYLNPPSGDDCTHVLVHDDGTLGWCDEHGEPSGSRFSIDSLMSEE